MPFPPSTFLFTPSSSPRNIFLNFLDHPIFLSSPYHFLFSFLYSNYHSFSSPFCPIFESRRIIQPLSFSPFPLFFLLIPQLSIILLSNHISIVPSSLFCHFLYSPQTTKSVPFPNLLLSFPFLSPSPSIPSLSLIFLNPFYSEVSQSTKTSEGRRKLTSC